MINKIWIIGAFLLLTAACGANQTPAPTPLNPGLFPPPGTTGPNAHTPVITPLSDGAAGPVTLPAGSATALPLTTNSGTSTPAVVLPNLGGDGVTTTPGNCPMPTGWVPYTVQTGDTLGTLATAHGITVQQLATSNCLTNADVIDVGQILFVPGSTTSP